ncbi:MAG: hypothetical protein FWD71_23675 [Oscillospiraceae bacterium]|nr:hypothetical protein [Oscillospiraceae bacterium]
MFFFRELYSESANDNHINSFDEWLSVTKNDYNTPQQMFLNQDGRDIEIQMPYVPGRSRTKVGYMREMSEIGFMVDSIIEMDPSRKTPDSVSIYVHKPV